MKKVGIVMGSIHDFDVVKPAIDVLKQFGVEVVARVISAHRTPNEAKEFATTAKKEGIEVIISVAGKAAHLGGVIASFTTLPIIGLPVKSSLEDGMDSLLSTVQMPNGVPVATVAINGGLNAGLLAIQMLALKYEDLDDKLAKYKEDMAKSVNNDNAKLQDLLK
ncbi:MAG: 5-(carboxyamino)imidazole ribonucleotide mutase [Clostridia bacterium]|nr:5-(carboxyamino)imidazole ribonucleotide mutase [Clostridia bacterium]MDY5264392.1 5-(carboxyamino)imidazole ribonucleotide mutase [Eubacteriales bacterium]